MNDQKKIGAHEANIRHYEDRYRSGYGLVYPDGHVIRFHRHILEYELGLGAGNILDYGCGTGTHLKYFETNGFTPFGCDISTTAIEQCKRLIPEYAENFHVVESVPDLLGNFDVDFDIVFSNQTLYFLNDAGIKDLVAQFHEMLRPGGIFFATMMATTNYFSRYTEPTTGDMSKVVLKGRLNQSAYVNFKDRDEVLELFKPFEKLHMGFYSHTIREQEGPTDHYIFVGRK